MRSVQAAAALLAALCLPACVAVPVRPLATQADLAGEVRRLTVDPSQIRLEPLKARVIDPAKGLDPTAVAILAVLNSPELKARRAVARVAAAQAFSAGLLPDPQIAFSLDIPNPGQGALTAYNINPNLDLATLITHAPALKAARASSQQADLDLLWAEWSTAQQARQLAVSILAAEAKARLLAAIVAELDARSRQSSRAFLRRDVAAGAAGADLAARADAEGQRRAAAREAVKGRGDLDALLGLAPEVSLDLVADAPAPDLGGATIEAALEALPRRRPDLLALRAGYGAQDANLRKAVLMQYPLVNLGFSHQRDNTGILSNGLTTTFTIPLFNRGRGEIAVQSATREKLAAEYQSRLDQTVADVAAARRERDAAGGALADLEARTPALIEMAARARPAADRGDIDSAAFLALDQAALKAQVAVLDQRLALTLADIGLETVLFLPAQVDTAR